MNPSVRCAGFPAILMVLLMLLTPMVAIATADGGTEGDDGNDGDGGGHGDDISTQTLTVLATYENPSNGHTYHLLESANRSESEHNAEALGGSLVTIDDSGENQYIVSTFASWNGTPRDIWIGLSDVDKEGYWEWDNPQPAWYRNWARSEPTMEAGEDYAMISSMAGEEIEIGQWTDELPERSAHGLVEIGSGPDLALLFPWVEEEVGVEMPQAVIEDVDDLFVENQLTLEARVLPHELDGSRFIMMKGDYGWGMHLTDGEFHYANDYAIRNHPSVEGLEFVEGEWAHLAVVVEEGVGGSFYVDGELEGTFDAEDAEIPVGEFGSNDCYQSGEDCDEFYLARQGAGCDCNHFTGIMDDVRVWNRALSAEEMENLSDGKMLNSTGLILNLDLDEGSGDISRDAVSLKELQLYDAIWVDQGGDQLANPIELENHDDIWDIGGKDGTRHLYWIDVPERVQFMNIEFWGWDGLANMLVRRGAIPTEDTNDYSSQDSTRGGGDWDIGFGYGNFAWPEKGVWWVLIEGESVFEDYHLALWWNEVPAPPPLEQMTELNDGIPVPDQDISSGEVAYYYVNVTEPLDQLVIDTYGGDGDGDLYVAYDADPAEWNGGEVWWMDDWGEPEGRQKGSDGDGPKQGGNNAAIISGDERYGSSRTGDNQERVTIISPEEGIWYIAVEAFENTYDMNIKASFRYPPANADPINSIELQPGVEYSPINGNEDSDRHFHIVVPLGTERLEVELSDGEGDADLFTSLEDVPTRIANDAGSSTFGNSEFIGINSPTPGTWHILVTGFAEFSDATIKASFTEKSELEPEIRPIELFNGEAVHNLRAVEDEVIHFYFILEDEMDSVSVRLEFGQGNPDLFVEYDDGEKWESTGRGAWESVWIEQAEPGRYSVEVVAARDFEGVSITAFWNDWDDPVDPIDPPENVQKDCKASAEWAMELMDWNEDGELDEEEFWAIDEPGIEPGWEDDRDATDTRGRQSVELPVFSEIDVDESDSISFSELLAFTCSCSMELEIAEQWSDGEMDEDDFKDFEWKNDFTFYQLDLDGDGEISWREFDDARETCETTWDPFDLEQPDRPEDPEEEKKEDDSGEGILGTEYLAGVDEEIAIPVAAGVGILVLVLIILAFAQVRRGNAEDAWANMQQDVVSRQTEAMLSSASGPVPSFSDDIPHLTPDPVSIPSTPEPITMTSTVDIGDSLSELGLEDSEVDTSISNAPPSHIMGALQGDGSEQIEWPSGSGITFTRSSFDAEWTRR